MLLSWKSSSAVVLLSLGLQGKRAQGRINLLNEQNLDAVANNALKLHDCPMTVYAKPMALKESISLGGTHPYNTGLFAKEDLSGQEVGKLYGVATLLDSTKDENVFYFIGSMAFEVGSCVGQIATNDYFKTSSVHNELPITGGTGVFAGSSGLVHETSLTIDVNKLELNFFPIPSCSCDKEGK